jgi:hypothetical protein
MHLRTISYLTLLRLHHKNNCQIYIQLREEKSLINNVCFFHSHLAPLSPRFIAEQCLCHDDQSGTSSGMLAWSMRDIGAIQGFILELDNGKIGSEFRVS